MKDEALDSKHIAEYLDCGVSAKNLAIIPAKDLKKCLEKAGTLKNVKIGRQLIDKAANVSEDYLNWYVAKFPGKGAKDSKLAEQAEEFGDDVIQVLGETTEWTYACYAVKDDVSKSMAAWTTPNAGYVAVLIDLSGEDKISNQNANNAD